MVENTWRSQLRNYCINVLFRLIYVMHGVYHIEEANPEMRPKKEDVKILVVAPHTSILDGLHWFFMVTSAVIKSSFSTILVISDVIASISPIYVDREIQASRQLTAQAIIKHVNKPNSLPLCFFPEGTTTNGKSLIHFKPGAFIAGLPVHPVLIQFPKQFGLSTNLTQWSLIGGPDNVCMMTLLQLCVPYQRAIIKWLPEYLPSEDEKNCPELYSHNVQKYMADQYQILDQKLDNPKKFPGCVSTRAFH